MSKVIVVTGASAGIGEKIAVALAAKGHSLALASRRTDELGRVAAACGERALAVPTDVSIRAEVERLRDEALRRFDHVDVWINNVGRGIARTVLELTDEDLDEMWTVNVKSALYGMQAIVPHFQARGRGHLINISSFLGKVPVASVRSAYSASKAALNSLTANLRMDLRSTHPAVNVSLVLPGMVATEFAKNALHGTPGPGAPPVGPFRPQTPDEVAEVVARLIDEPAAEVYTNPLQKDLAARYVGDTAGTEALMAHR